VTVRWLVVLICCAWSAPAFAAPEPIVILGLRPGSRSFEGPTELKRLGEAQKLRRVANSVVREIAERPIIDDGGLRTVLGVEYLVDFMDCRAVTACIVKRTTKLKKLATYMVYGEYTVAGPEYRFRIKLFELRQAKIAKQVEFTLTETDVEDRKLWRREVEPLFEVIASKPPDPPAEPPVTPAEPPGDPDVPELAPITTTPEPDPNATTAVEGAATASTEPFIDTSVLDAINQGITWHGHFQHYSAVGVRGGGLYGDFVTFDDRLQLEFESDLNHVRVVGKPQLLLDVRSESLDVRFREMYAARDYRRVDFAVGQQVVTWGVTDFFPVVDIINARDYASLRNWKPIDEKLPVTALQSRALLGPVTLHLLAVPVMKRGTFQLDPKQPFALPLPTPPGATIEQPKNAAKLGNSGGGIRIDLAVGAWKLSTYALIGRDPLPAVYVKSDPITMETRLVVDNDRVAAGALSIVGTLPGDFLLKAEGAAYHRLDDECEGDPACFYTRRVPTGRANIAIERKISSGLDAHLQFISELTRSKDVPRLPPVIDLFAPGLPEQFNWRRMVTMNLRGSYLRGDFVPQLFVYWSPDDEDYFANADVEIHLADGYALAVGGFLFDGYAADENKNRYTLAGAQKRSTNAYLRVTAWF
jgi:hypothetical protein